MNEEHKQGGIVFQHAGGELISADCGVVQQIKSVATFGDHDKA